MQCPTPISIKDKSDKNPKNLASIRQTVPCGRCGICKKNKRTEWTFRLREQLKDSKNCHFVTLTYSDENLPYHPETGEISLRKKHLQDFIKRLREYEYRKTNQRSIRYYAIGEYGSKTKRPHYHALIYNLSKSGTNNLPNIWGYGHTHIGTVTPASIHYVTKYHVNRNTYEEDSDERSPEFSIMSQKLGYGYIERNWKYHLENNSTVCKMDGYNINMPRIFRQKIFTDEHLKRLSIENQIRSEVQANKEADRLEKQGYKNGHYEQHKRALKKGSKIKQKHQDNDIL